MNATMGLRRRAAGAWRSAIVVLAVLVADSALAQSPTYSVTQPDAITGDNPTQNFSVPGVSCSGCRLPDANGATSVDNYYLDVYERPTASGSGANVFYAALDITSGQVGYDANYLYYRINLYGIDTSSAWLPYQYGFEINFDSEGRGDLFVRVDSPSSNVGGTWGTNGVIGFWDQNNNLGNPNISLPDGPGAVPDGYENLAFDQGSNKIAGAPGGNDAIVARVVGTVSAPAVELAVKRVFMNALNGGPVLRAAFRPYSAKGGGTTSASNLPLHDKYSRNDAGSPFPWLTLTGAPAICPSGLDSALTAAQRAALDSGTNVNTGINNPCYPSRGNIEEMDNGGTITGLVGGNDISFVVDISGRVFEDVNYGGGAGRACGAVSGSPTCSTTSGALGRNGARVELYTVGGGTATYATATTTNANGDYTFTNQPGNSSYLVRVVNGSVTSSRTGAVSGLLPVQTFRTSGLTSNVGTADASRVGGERPDLADGGDGGTGDTINTTTGAASGLASGSQAQSIAPFAAGTQNIRGVDFGFNFDTIVNVNNSGQGSLRQFILNSRALGGEASLAQAGSRINGVTGAAEALPAGRETSIFMIPGAAAVAGLRAGLTNQLTGGVAVIAPTSLLEAIVGSNAGNTSIDGGTQSFNVGNTNAGTLGAGGTVGTDPLTLPLVQRPEVQLIDSANAQVGIDVDADSVTVRGLSIYGFGNTPSNNNHGNILVRNNRSGTLIEQNVIGGSATGFTDPVSTVTGRSAGDNLRVGGGDNGVIRNNLIGFAAGNGIGLGATATGWQFTSNEIRGNAIGTPARGGIEIDDGSAATIEGNLIVGNVGPGFDNRGSTTGNNTLRSNTITGNGIGGTETPGVRVYASGTLLERNVISGNYGAGVMVDSAASSNRISRNSIFANGTITTGGATGTPNSGQIGIDLLRNSDAQDTGSAPFVTLNDSGDGDSGGNDLLNYPIIESAAIAGGNLTLTGFARPGSLIELFVAAADPSGFGEGQTYLVTLTEGSGADLDATTATYGPAAVNGVAQGTDNTNRFRFTIPVPGGVTTGTVLTATATIGSNTSEFSGLVTVAAAVVPLTHVKSLQVVRDPYNGTTNPKAIPGAEVLYTLLIANPGSGSIDSNSIAVVDPIPANTKLYLGDLGGAGSGPIAFSNGSPSSGLSWTYTSLSNLTDDLEFSNNGGTSWNHLPTADGSGYDTSNTTHIRMRPKGVMAGSSGSGNPSFQLQFRVRIN